jgi:hypothetical protein
MYASTVRSLQEYRWLSGPGQYVHTSIYRYKIASSDLLWTFAYTSPPSFGYFIRSPQSSESLASHLTFQQHEGHEMPGGEVVEVGRQVPVPMDTFPYL